MRVSIFSFCSADLSTNINKTFHIFRFHRVGLPLPGTDGPDGPRIMLIRPGTYDPNQYTISDVMRVSTMMNDLLMLEDDHMTIAGQVIKS
jgi:hypothetical protein